MNDSIPLDAHSHLDPSRTSGELEHAGAVLAMTLSLAEAGQVIGHKATQYTGTVVAWGVGCHPRKHKAQEAFDPDRFAGLVEQAALIGEIGLDTGSPVPFDRQLQTFRQALQVAARRPCLVSIHSYQATAQVLEELRRTPIAAPVLHGWTGTAVETRQAVEMGCYFSIHSQVARHAKFRAHVPLDRVLVETDHGWADPPAAIPCRIEWVEWLVAAQRGLSREQIRQAAWRNFVHILRETGTLERFPAFLELVKR